jgi:hypothetical protein
MRILALHAALTLLLGVSAIAGEGIVPIAIDFEEAPRPDLERIDNIYHGGAEFLYAFLVVRNSGTARMDRVSGYDVGYRLVCPDSSVINHGFHRLNEWAALDAAETAQASDTALPGARLPAAIGYWKLELKRGQCSRAEFQLVPNPLNGRDCIVLEDDSQNMVTLQHLDVSQDVTCDGLINATYSMRGRFRRDEATYIPGEIVARFKSGVVLVEEARTAADAIIDPGLAEIAEDYGLIGIRRLFTRAMRGQEALRSRTGRKIPFLDKRDVFILSFPDGTDLVSVTDRLLALPRCVYAHPCVEPEPSAFFDCEDWPNDPLAVPDSSWHLCRIGMPAAWEITHGVPAVRIGVADAGLDYHLVDFGSGFGTGHKVAGGYDYADDDPDPSRLWDDDANALYEHGNWVTSVAGALTNNEIGVAGVAGGWGGAAAELGPSVYHLKFREDSGGVYSYGAMVDAIADAPSYSLAGLSLSWHVSRSNDLKEALYDCHAADMVFISTFRNDFVWQQHRYGYAGTFWPGCYRDDWVLAVQGTNYHPTSPEDPIPERRISGYDTPYTWGACWPDPSLPLPFRTTDVSAPASHMCVIYSDSLGNEKPAYRTDGSGISYGPAQVLGAIGLMHSVASGWSDFAADMQGVLSASATDVLTDCETSDSLPGWDLYSGWGRVNVDSCLKIMQPWSGWHVGEYKEYGGGFVADISSELETVTFATRDDRYLSGDYLVRRYEIRRSVWKPSGLDAGPFIWARPCDTGGWGWSGETKPYDDYNLQEPYCGLIPSSQKALSCTLYTYTYEVWNVGGAPPETTYLGWYPNEPGLLDWEYSALGCCIGGVPGGDDPKADRAQGLISVMPNPAVGTITVEFTVPRREQVSISVYDVQGRMVRSVFAANAEPGLHKTLWDGRDSSGRRVAPGLYILRMKMESSTDAQKIVILREGDH